MKGSGSILDEARIRSRMTFSGQYQRISEMKIKMKSRQSSLQSTDNQKRIAYHFIVLMGIVSLFGDITYEGARSITGPYFAILGASAGIVGLVSGLGEFIGYALRLVSGYSADRTKSYWPLTIAGSVKKSLRVQEQS